MASFEWRARRLWCRLPHRPKTPARRFRSTDAAAKQQAGLVVFPALGITGYANDDLFFQDALLEAAETAVVKIDASSQKLPPVIVGGAPIRTEANLFNRAVIIHGGAIHGVVPKSYLSNYRGFYEKHQFCPANQALSPSNSLLGHEVSLGTNLIFEARACPGIALHVELCEDS
jgi:NAD+ synthase (glutamine-hydrolysing)